MATFPGRRVRYPALGATHRKSHNRLPIRSIVFENSFALCSCLCFCLLVPAFFFSVKVGFCVRLKSETVQTTTWKKSVRVNTVPGSQTRTQSEPLSALCPNERANHWAPFDRILFWSWIICDTRFSRHYNLSINFCIQRSGQKACHDVMTSWQTFHFQDCHHWWQWAVKVLTH